MAMNHTTRITRILVGYLMIALLLAAALMGRYTYAKVGEAPASCAPAKSLLAGEPLAQRDTAPVSAAGTALMIAIHSRECRMSVTE